ncbi:hypothetical protein BDP27DRAFT_1370701 [Rhodocollybia butyracea]|uniref:Uncharacterized protein n=1 Tax=Rhodocollybia butyracea TaxID=206335 RepID=A0A9P5TYX6_9AGAR|nr:hypothetical protein BDP27DRAFT_1370701 [Rhodocollybia butyracea]
MALKDPITWWRGPLKTALHDVTRSCDFSGQGDSVRKVFGGQVKAGLESKVVDFGQGSGEAGLLVRMTQMNGMGRESRVKNSWPTNASYEKKHTRSQYRKDSDTGDVDSNPDKTSLVKALPVYHLLCSFSAEWYSPFYTVSFRMLLWFAQKQGQKAASLS